MLDKSQIKRLVSQCDGKFSFGEDCQVAHVIFEDTKLQQFAQACYQQGREDMHGEVMAEVNKDNTRWDKHIADRLKELK